MTLSLFELRAASRALEAEIKKREAGEEKAATEAGAYDVELAVRIAGVYTKLTDTTASPQFPEAKHLQEKLQWWALSQPEPERAIQAILTASPPAKVAPHLVEAAATATANYLAAAKSAFKKSATAISRSGATSFAGVVERINNEQ
jgi:hypothetical protein